MLAHGRDELEALADLCVIEELGGVAGWALDRWRMDDADVDAAVAVYAAVLTGGAEADVMALLSSAGLDLNVLLMGEGKDDITRSDLTELTAAATLVAKEGCAIDGLVMPNVPKMSRRKSDSGIDIFATTLDAGAAPGSPLTPGETLTIGSVKHSVTTSTTAPLRLSLDKSVSEGEELSATYLVGQLRVLGARLQSEGFPERSIGRIYLFAERFPQVGVVSLIAIGIVAPDREADVTHHVSLLRQTVAGVRTFRTILMPGLRDVHKKCP